MQRTTSPNTDSFLLAKSVETLVLAEQQVALALGRRQS